MTRDLFGGSVVIVVGVIFYCSYYSPGSNRPLPVDQNVMAGRYEMIFAFRYILCPRNATPASLRSEEKQLFVLIRLSSGETYLVTSTFSFRIKGIDSL